MQPLRRVLQEPTSLKAAGMVVIVGGYDRQANDGVPYEVQSYIIVDTYKRHKGHDEHDIALVKLKHRILFSDQVATVCLPMSADYTGEDVVVAGWGITEKGNLSRLQLKSHLKVMDTNACRKSASIGPKFSETTNLCAYGYKTDACQSDSGSPLIHQIRPYKYETIGIVSWGDGCATAGVPGVYVNLRYFLRWILANTRDGVYCRKQ